MTAAARTLRVPVAAAPRRTLCLEAHELLLDRETRYGPMDDAFDEVAQIAMLLRAPDDTPSDVAVLVQLATKLVRRTYSPENPDHYRDAIGYLGVLWEKRAARAKAARRRRAGAR